MSDAPRPDPEAPLDLAAVELPPPSEGERLRLLLALLSLVELLLALWLAMADGQGWCPGSASSWSCGTLFRPRLGALGPFTVASVGALGAGLTLLAAWDLLLRGRAAASAVWLPLLGAGAGFAVGIQALALGAQGALCPWCLLLALLSVGVAALAAAATRGARAVALAAALALLVVSPLAWWRGAALAAEDQARRRAALETRGEAGPRLLLFQREGCAYCQALVPDVLGDPALLSLLGRTRGVELVGPGDPRVAALGVDGVPMLVAVDASGRALARHPGYGPPAEAAAWLERVLITWRGP